jgi:hypothetical protein
MGYSADEIKAVLKDKTDKPPIGIILMLKAITTDMEKGDISNFEKLLDRAYGKPEKTINHEIGTISPETVAKLNAIFDAPREQRQDETKRRSVGTEKLLK